MKDITLEELLEAGCHFGHQVTRQNPKARDFVFEQRDGIHIIDLAKTKEGLEEAAQYILNLAKNGGSLVVTGTKRQARDIVEKEVKRAIKEIAEKTGAKEQDIFYVTNRWVGGTFTNTAEVIKNYKKLKDLTQALQSEERQEGYTKKEIGLWEKERQKLDSFYTGIMDMKKLPDAIFIVDTHLENLAVAEAKRMNITTVGIVDTNADPDLIDYVIPANDDAVGSLELIITYIIDAWIEGNTIHQAEEKELTEKKETAPETKIAKKEKAPKGVKEKKVTKKKVEKIA